MLSVIIPAYNEEAMARKAAETIGDLLTFEGIGYELIFVNDGSKDNTQAVLEQIAEENPRAHYIQFSRNFGKEAAISAGLAMAKGDCVAVMDCDLQHPPQTLLEMYRLWEQGYEVIEGVKRDRGNESAVYRLGAKSFYRIMSRAIGIDMSHASDFKLLDRKAVDALLSLPEYHMFFRALSHWVGYRTASVSFDVQKREAGQSKWSPRSLTKYAINNIMEFSSVPLQIVTWIGVLAFILSCILGLQTLVRYFMGQAAEGFTTVILLLLFLGSVIMIGLGIIGMYIAKIYDEVKRRPRYIITKMK